MVLLGGLLALIGQTYQTGADTWELFALWAALSLPWVLAGRHAALWLTWALLLNVTLTLWLDLGRAWWMPLGTNEALLSTGLLNALLLLAWELAGTRWAEFSARAGRRLLALAMIAPLVFAGMDDIFDKENGAGIACWLVVTLVAGACFLRLRRDLPVLAMLMLGVIAVVTSALAQYVFSGSEDSAELFLTGLSVIAQGRAAAFVLRRVARGEAA